MSRDENIIRTYRDGSAEVRMDTYLAHPSLRDRFDEIEREEEWGSPLTSPPETMIKDWSSERAWWRIWA